MCVCWRDGGSVCLYTDIHEWVCGRQMRKVLDGVSQLISHYGGEQWMNQAADRRKQSERRIQE